MTTHLIYNAVPKNPESSILAKPSLASFKRVCNFPVVEMHTSLISINILLSDLRLGYSSA